MELEPERDVVEPQLKYFYLGSTLVSLSFTCNLNVRIRAVFQLTSVLNL